jgi:hypothetical protein
MTIEQAAQSLNERLRANPWFTAVGIGEHNGEPCLFLYVKSLRHADLAFLHEGWCGYPVEVRRMGPPRVAARPFFG